MLHFRRIARQRFQEFNSIWSQILAQQGTRYTIKTQIKKKRLTINGYLIKLLRLKLSEKNRKDRFLYNFVEKGIYEKSDNFQIFDFRIMHRLTVKSRVPLIVSHRLHPSITSIRFGLSVKFSYSFTCDFLVVLIMHVEFLPHINKFFVGKNNTNTL